MNSLDAVLGDVRHYFSENYNGKIDKIFLYGSYSRGDQDDESDIDFLIIVPGDDLTVFQNKTNDLVDFLLDKYSILGSFLFESKASFERYKDVSGFYKNVVKEGRIIYGA